AVSQRRAVPMHRNTNGVEGYNHHHLLNGYDRSPIKNVHSPIYDVIYRTVFEYLKNNRYVAVRNLEEIL
ncbi:hypothetical protein JW960_03355, partial [candidate division KSB1 bacterium]|nr:hypothetical protein [candidate division KSB1 bacterium]